MKLYSDATIIGLLSIPFGVLASFGLILMISTGASSVLAQLSGMVYFTIGCIILTASISSGASFVLFQVKEMSEK